MKGIEKQGNQDGLASLMVTTVLILVIALIITGFSTVARRNQREVLDRQLSSQAIYAAESGINRTVAAIRELNVAPPSQTECNPQNAIYPNIRLDQDNVEVTCTLVDAQPKNLQYMAVTENTPTVVPLTTNSAPPIASITIKWNKTGGGTNVQGCSTSVSGLPTRSQWGCGLGILRVDLASSLSGGAVSTFYYPLKGSNATQGSGGIVPSSCIDSPEGSYCTVTITGLNSTAYYMNLRSIYHDSDVTITAADVNGTEVRFNGQVSIDVTARAQDVVKRLQVRVPLESSKSDIPAYAIESSGSICKRFSVFPGDYYTDITAPCN